MINPFALWDMAIDSIEVDNTTGLNGGKRYYVCCFHIMALLSD
jgi:hypothetical protein